jgi:tRNA threonylcarbamoyladenosine biosynthesis protein TsaB
MSERLLAIDTATEACSAALFIDGVSQYGIYEMLERGHAERLIPMIAELPDKGRADRILVNIGPGSFTGVRVGLAAAKALAIAWSAPVSGYQTHSLIAQMARSQLASKTEPSPSDDYHAFIVAMHGGHGEYFIQTFNDNAEPRSALHSCKPEAAFNMLSDRLAPSSIITGSAAAPLQELLRTGLALPLWPDARCALSVHDVYRNHEASPVYGRQPDAAIAKKLAIEPTLSNAIP